jgi:ClpX C4-type zinc finger protein
VDVDKHMSLGTTLARIGRFVRPPLRCSFCGSSADDVQYLVAGASAHICDACIIKCVAVLEQHGAPFAPVGR